METVPASPEPAVDLRPVAAEDEEFLWGWLHGTPDPEWKRWDAPYFHAGDTPVPDRSAFAVTTPDTSRTGTGGSSPWTAPPWVW